MPQSLTQLYLHIIFSTKHGEPLIDENIEGELFRYLGGICAGLKCQPIQVGGYRDHVHILTRYSKAISVINLLQEIKISSSKWIKTVDDRYSKFRWQDGYAAITIGYNQVASLEHYIRNQKAHHEKISYQDECRAIFNEFSVEYDERYVWD